MAPLRPVAVELCRRTLSEFIASGWHVLEPGNPFVDGPHIKIIADYVQAILEDWEQSTTSATRPPPLLPQDHVINVPPGTMKSLIVSVFAPAWMWLRCPWWRAIYASSGDSVALRDSVKCRMLIDSEWYQTSFKPSWKWADDQNAKGNYKNTMGGFRMATTTARKITGERADFLGVDDPLDATDAESNSKAARDAVLFWWDQAFYNRVNDSVRSKRLVIMQRLHEDDLAGHLKKSGTAVSLVLPMEFVPERADPLDWRTIPGELLFPARFPESVLAQERKRLGSWGYSGQMQQDPVPAGGGMFPAAWWRFWTVGKHQAAGARPQGCASLPPRALPLKFDSLTMSVDCNFKDAATSDYVALEVWGRLGADSYLLHLFHERCGLVGTIAAIRAAHEAFPDIYSIVVEEAANGFAVVELLRSEIAGIIAVKPIGGKEARAAAIQPQIEAGNVFLPEDASWTHDFIAEFSKFPKGSNDDMVDACSQYLTFEHNSDLRRLEALCTL